MYVLDRLLASIFAEKLDGGMIAAMLKPAYTVDASCQDRQLRTLGVLDIYTQVVAQRRIQAWLYEHRDDPDVIALDQTHRSLRNEHDSLQTFLIQQANVGIRDVWKLIAVIAPLYHAIYQRTISQQELLEILRGDSFGKILFRLAISAAEVVDPLQKEMMIQALKLPNITIFDPRDFILEHSKNGIRLQFSPHFQARLHALQPDKLKSPIFTGCPLTYLKTRGDNPKNYIGALAHWCVDFAEVHYVSLFAAK